MHPDAASTATRLTRLRPFVPYVVVLAVAGYFYYLASNFRFEYSPERLGPDGWPKLLLICLGVVCLYEIGRRLLALRRDAAPVDASAPPEDDDAAALELPDEQAHPARVALAVALTVLYLVLLETVGFFIATFVYTSVLMWIGNFRSVVWNLGLSFAFSFAFMFAFMRIIFVDLPLGVEPFAKVSTALMRLMGVH